MDDHELLAACRHDVAADQRLAAAIRQGAASEEYADTGEMEHDGDAAHLARIYSVRVTNLARQGLLLVDELTALAELSNLATAQGTVRAIVRFERHRDRRIVYTAILADEPPRVRACLVHTLPD